MEQVKGMTYSLDALLGTEPPGSSTSSEKTRKGSEGSIKIGDEDIIKADQEFANMNGSKFSKP